jgi:baseplate J-like protein
MTFGLTAAGFQRKQATDIQSSISTTQKQSFGQAWASDLPDSVIGQVNGSMVNELDDLWQLGNAVWSSGFLGTSQGISLDLILQEIGVRRPGATPSVVTLTITGTPGAAVPLTFQAKVPTNGAVFQVTSTAVVGGGGTVNVPAACIVDGPILAPAGTCTQIVSPVPGLASVTNAADAVPGQNALTDSQTRVFAVEEQQADAAAIVEAIRASVLKVTGVTQCLVYNNPGSATDGNGIPGHAFAAVVVGGADQDIFNAIFNVAPAGITIYGTTTGTVTDTQGIAQPVAFTRPTLLQVYVSTLLAIDAGSYGGDPAVQSGVVAYADTLQIAQTLVWNKLFGVIYAATTGIDEIDNLFTGTSASPSGVVDITATAFELIQIQTANVVVTHA